MPEDTAIPGAPGFSAPGNLTPDELKAFLMRLRFGGSNFTVPGREITPGGEQFGPAATPENQAEPQTPGAVSAMLDFAKNAAPSINGGYREHVLAKLGRTSGPAAPTTPAEYETLYPSAGPGAHDLPEDVFARKQFTDAYTAQLAGEETKAKAVKEQAEAGKLTAEAGNVGDTEAATMTALGRASANPNLDRETASGIANFLLEKAGGKAVPPKAKKAAPAPEPSLLSKIGSFLGGAAIGPPGDLTGAAGAAPAGPAPTPATAGPGLPPGWNPPPSRLWAPGVEGGGQAAGPTERDMVPTKDPNVKMYNGKPYRRMPAGGWQLIK
jgi:hypothetical protein